MNPSTDTSQKITLPDGRLITVVTPNGRLVRTKNWRLNEQAYRNYEGHIRTALNIWPTETKFAVPVGMSPNTFEHRLRDALQAIKLFGYDADVQAQIAAIRGEVVVSQDIDGKHVWFRAKQRAGRPVQLHVGEVGNNRPDISTYVPIQPAPDEATLRAYCVLHAKGLRAEPTQFRGRIATDLITTLEGQYDTAFVYDEARDVTTML